MKKPTSLTDPRLVEIDKALKSMGLPSYTDTLVSFCNLLDGEDSDDVRDMGLPEADVTKIMGIKHDMHDLWLSSL